jgi:short-subunit dehydrogenase involved in D-alanine esterification of teichoic acids
MMKLSNNTVFITGGASGIGLSMAKAFIARNNKVIICGRNLDKLEKVKKEVPGIHAVRCDVTNGDDIRKTIEHLASQELNVNILVNNAGIQYRYDLLSDSSADQKIREEIEINFTSVASLTYRFLPILKKSPQAAVVNISSFLGIVPKGSAPVYCATKAALHVFSKALRYQLEQSSIKVFEVLTPLVDTDMTKGREDDVGKMSPDVLASSVLRGIEANRYEITPGKAKVVLLLNRLFPSLIEKVIKKR